MAFRRRGLLPDIRLSSTRCLRPVAAPGGPLGRCGRGGRFCCRLHGCRSLASRRWSSGALRRAHGFDHRSRSSLGGFARLHTCRLLQLGVLLAQPGDGALQPDDLMLELRLAQLWCGRRCCLPGCRTRRACKRRCSRLSGRRLHPVLRAGRTAEPLPGCRRGCASGRGAGRLGAAGHGVVLDHERVARSLWTQETIRKLPDIPAFAE